jgi:hypothetical protein
MIPDPPVEQVKPLRYVEATGNYDSMFEKSNAIFGQ